MHKNVYIIGAVIAVTLLGFIIFQNSNQTQQSAPVDDALEVSTTSTMPQNNLEPIGMPEETGTLKSWSLDYSPQTFAQSQSENAVTILFFHADWCPTCKAAAQDFETNISEIPNGIQIVKVDYDTESELKKTYAITTQHTFVAVDSEGNEITRWIGGGLDELIEELNVTEKQ